MRPRNKVLFIVSCFIVLFCSLTVLYWNGYGYYLSNRPCLSVLYPDGSKPGLELRKSYSYSTSDSIEHMLSFYIQQLDAVSPYKPGEANWTVEPLLNKSGYLFVCISVDITGTIVEQRCIYVRKENEGTVIETILNRSYEDIPYCDHRS